MLVVVGAAASWSGFAIVIPSLTLTMVRVDMVHYELESPEIAVTRESMLAQLVGVVGTTLPGHRYPSALWAPSGTACE